MSKSSSSGNAGQSSDTQPVLETGTQGGQPPAPQPTQPPAREDNQGKPEKPEPKTGLERYLQKFPQSSGITALLRLKHKADVKTISEWEVLIKELLHKKVQ
jgi:hypothetical protein